MIQPSFYCSASMSATAGRTLTALFNNPATMWAGQLSLWTTWGSSLSFVDRVYYHHLFS